MEYYLVTDWGHGYERLTRLDAASLEAAVEAVVASDTMRLSRAAGAASRAAILAVACTHPLDLDEISAKREELRERAELARLLAKYGEDTPQGAAVYLDPQGLLRPLKE